jgi:Transcriptional Coactivator p15 (PC4)
MAKKARRRDRGREPVQVTHHFKKKVIDEWPLNGGETMRVTIENYKGHDLVHIRRWQRGSNGQLYPTEKGAAVKVRQLPRLLKALKTIRVHAKKIGLLPRNKKKV